MAGCINMPLGMDVGLSRGDFVLDGDPVPSPQRGWSALPNFRLISIVAKRAGCIKMPLGMDVGLSPGEFVLDGDPVPSPKSGRSPQIFRTWHSRYWFVQVQVLVLYAFYF